MMTKIPTPTLTRAQCWSLVLVQFVVVFPHIFHLPIIFSVLCFLTLSALLLVIKKNKTGSQAQSFQAKPVKFAQVVVVCIGLAIILFQYRTLIGVDAGVAFLVLCLIGKLMELKQRRDAYIALTLALFVVASLFLFEKSIVNAIMGLLGILAVLYAMIQQNLNPDLLHAQVQPHFSQQQLNVNLSQGLWRSLAKLFLQAIPLLIILFIFFPRLPPLWSVPIPQDRAKTGMTDQMSPGDIASLSQSTELAFRVLDQNNNLGKNLPARDQLYWRGLVLSDFDGEKWTTSKDYRLLSTIWNSQQYQPEWFQQSFSGNSKIGFEYRVLLKPTQQQWLFALDVPFSSSKGVGLTREYNLKNSQDNYKDFSYDAVQVLGVKPDVELADWLAETNTALPSNNNPQSHQMAQQVFARLGQNPERYAQFWLKWIRQQNFVYTLQPPRLDGDRIDQFLLQTRRGFCEHYASAYAFLMRAVGIPARVVVGYQGGQLSPDAQSLEVRQMDAHAWVEVWFAGKGWVRIDPTAAIAPERIERGMNELMQQDQQLFGDGLMNQFKSNQFQLLGKVRVWADYASFVWQRDVVGFDQNKQGSLLSRLFGIKDAYSQVIWLSGLLIATLSAIFLGIWYKRRKIWHPLDRPLQQLSERLKKQQLERHPSEGMIAWLRRLQQHDQYAKRAKQLIIHYQQARYNQQDEAKHLHEIKKLVRHWPNR
jgi:transglutaminase-like putative cysteine protease